MENSPRVYYDCYLLIANSGYNEPVLVYFSSLLYPDATVYCLPFYIWASISFKLQEIRLSEPYQVIRLRVKTESISCENGKKSL